MGLTNWIVMKTMKKEAKKIADIVDSVKNELDFNSPEDIATKLTKAYSNKELSEMKKETQEEVKKKSLSVEGFCYMAGLDLGALQGFMIYRCLQFTQIMDNELYSRGISKQSRETKKQLMEIFKLNVGNWEAYL